MYKKQNIIIILIFIIIISNLTADNPKQKFIEDNNAFAIELYEQLAKEDGNIFFSPYSISTALAMTYAGARGNTEKEMSKVLHFNLSQNELHKEFSELSSHFVQIQNIGNIELNIANALWIQKNYNILDSFLNINTKYYNANLFYVDFINATDEAVQEINDWAEEHTKNKIKDILKKEDLHPLTRLILTNAIYFKGDWEYKFDKELTKELPFWKNENKKMMIPMMYQKGNFKYSKNEDYQMLELPYTGKELSMLILLPNEIDGLSRLEKYLSYILFTYLNQFTHQKMVEVYLPKFESTKRFGLKKKLEIMGMKDAFSGMADFSGITRSKKLFIHNIIHKAYVKVDEQGTEAAAATAVIMAEVSYKQSTPIFKADHPFIFLIRDNETGSILFIGRIVDPLDK